MNISGPGQLFIAPVGTDPRTVAPLTGTISLDIKPDMSWLDRIVNRRHPMFHPGRRQRAECVVCGRDTAVRPAGRRKTHVTTETYTMLGDVAISEVETDEPRLYRHRLRDAPTVAGLYDGDWCPGSAAVVSVPNRWTSVGYTSANFSYTPVSPIVYEDDGRGNLVARRGDDWSAFAGVKPPGPNPFKIITTT